MIGIYVLFIVIFTFLLVEAAERLRYKDIDVKLISDNDETFQSKMESLIRSIPEKTERSHISQEIFLMESRINSITFDMKYLNRSVELEDDLKKSIVLDLNYNLLHIVNVFDHHSTAFRKHPLFAAKILFSLPQLVADYHRIAVILNPELATKSNVECTLERVLNEYKLLVIVDRLAAIEIICGSDPQSSYILDPNVSNCTYKNVFKAITSDIEFDENKLNEIYDCALHCDSSTLFFRDRLSENCGFKTYKRKYTEDNECVTDLMIYLKYHVEKQFKESSEILSGLCQSQAYSNGLVPTTGFGWLTVNVLGANWTKKCDYWGECELFVKVLANGIEICKTPSKTDLNRVDFFTSCTSEKIDKTSNIEFQLWDDDVRNDDLLHSWRSNVSEITGTERPDLPFTFIAVWKDEFQS